MGPLANFKMPKGTPKKVNLLKWIDDVEQNRKGKKEGLRLNDFENDLLKKKEISNIEIHRNVAHNEVTNTLRKKNLTL